MAIYRIKLKNRRQIAEGTMAFHFEKPKEFSYKAGQFADYTLINPAETDPEGNIRGFSLASAPYEDSLMFYIVGPAAMVDAFRNVLNDAGVNPDNIRTEEFTGY